MKSIIVYQSSLLIGVAGLALIIVGSFSFIWFDELSAVLHDESLAVPISALVLGCFLVLVPIGLIKVFSLRVCIGVWTVTVLILITLGSLALAFNGSTVDAVQSRFETLFEFRTNDVSQRIINEIQENLRCCGDTGPDRWAPTAIPSSCCPAINNVLDLPCLAPQAFNVGCVEQLGTRITLSNDLVGWTSIGYGIFMTVVGIATGVGYYKRNDF